MKCLPLIFAAMALGLGWMAGYLYAYGTAVSILLIFHVTPAIGLALAACCLSRYMGWQQGARETHAPSTWEGVQNPLEKP